MFNMFHIFITYTTANVYTGNNRVLMETSITEFHEKFYILAIQKLIFHLHICLS